MKTKTCLIVSASLVIGGILSSCSDWDDGNYYISGGYASGGYSSGGYLYDSLGYPIFGYMGGRPVYGYSYWGSPIFSFTYINSRCYVPNWRPAPYCRGQYNIPKGCYRVGTPPQSARKHKFDSNRPSIHNREPQRPEGNHAARPNNNRGNNHGAQPGYNRGGMNQPFNNPGNNRGGHMDNKPGRPQPGASPNRGGNPQFTSNTGPTGRNGAQRMNDHAARRNTDFRSNPGASRPQPSFDRSSSFRGGNSSMQPGGRSSFGSPPSSSGGRHSSMPSGGGTRGGSEGAGFRGGRGR